MTDKLTRALMTSVTQEMSAKQEGERADLRKINLGKRAREGDISQKFNDWMDAKSGSSPTRYGSTHRTTTPTCTSRSWPSI